MVRKCQKCGDSKNMIRVVDAQMNITDVRFRVCFQCEYNLEHQDEGDLVYYLDNEREEAAV